SSRRACTASSWRRRRHEPRGARPAGCDNSRFARLPGVDITAWRQHLSSGHPLSGIDAALLGHAIATAREVWPAAQLPDVELIASLAERTPSDLTLRQAVERQRVSDVLIACACARGDAAAIAALDARYLAGLPLALRRTSDSDARIADALQNLRVKL